MSDYKLGSDDDLGKPLIQKGNLCTLPSNQTLESKDQKAIQF